MKTIMLLLVMGFMNDEFMLEQAGEFTMPKLESKSCCFSVMAPRIASSSTLIQLNSVSMNTGMADCTAIPISTEGLKPMENPQKGRVSAGDEGVETEISTGRFNINAIEELAEFDAAEFLTSEESIAAYLNEFLEDQDPAMLAHALGTAARARGMTAVAKDSGLARESLYKALRPDSSPRFETVVKVMRAFGVRLVAQPIHETKSEVIS